MSTTSKQVAAEHEKSIQHWQRLATGKRHGKEEPYAECCALCKLFIDVDCVGCPVSDDSGARGCYNTPYMNAVDAWEEKGPDSKEFRAAARKELAFLKSLRTKGKK